MRHRGRLAAGFVVAGVIAGCGGGSADEFRARADRVCADTRAAVDNVGEARTLTGLSRLAPRVRDRAQAGIRKLRELGEPPEGVDGWPELLAALDAQLPLLDRLADAPGSSAVERLAIDGRALEARADRAAKRAGVRTCGTSPATPGG